jgi:rhomboid domain-containing protein 1
MPPAGFPGGAFPPGGAAWPGGRRRGSWRRNDQHTLLSLGMLLAQQVAGMEHKPPLTLALVAAQVLLFLKPEGIDEVVPSIRAACLQPAAVLRGQWARLLWAPLLHADSLHLYYNMSSLLWKVGAAVRLRCKMGAG